MYERMLDKQNKPSIEEFSAFLGASRELFEQADGFLTHQLKLEKLMRFPYGNSYGWGIKYFIKKKHICDIFAEKDAFTAMLRLSSSQYDSVYHELLPYTKEYIDNKYPCGSGGWIQYRVINQEHLEDLKKMLLVKAGK